jgi:hypothetical protein
MRFFKTTVVAGMMFSAFAAVSHAQVKLGKVLVISTPVFAGGADSKAYEGLVTGQMAPAWKKNVPGVELYLLKAERAASGVRKPDYLTLWVVDTPERRNGYLPESPASAFPNKVTGKLGSLAGPPAGIEPGQYTDYELIGGDRIGALPQVDLIGIHYIKVKPDSAADFEKFVGGRLHPALASITPGMRMLYYKGVRGERAGSFILIFAIDSYAARERYWPTGKPETDVTKAAFKPLNPLARELGTYLVEGSYLAPTSGGAAAYFESLEWVDFMRVGAGGR